MTEKQQWPRCEAQWKGTATCLDAVCGECGKYAHYCIEMPWSGLIQCPHCKNMAAVSAHLTAVSIGNITSLQNPVVGGQNMNPFKIEQQRERINTHKNSRLNNPYRAHSYQQQTPESCIRLWIEQIGDAELYEQRWHELTTTRGHE